MSREENPRQLLQSVIRAFEIAELLAEAGELGVTEIDARLASGAPRRGEREEHLVDRRDWRNQAHTGTRAARRLSLPMSSAPAATEPTP